MSHHLATLPELTEYEIIEKIGQGRYADVYRAIKRDIEQEVAIKILHPALLDENQAFRILFEERARRSASLRHHSMVSVLDMGSEGRLLFVALEYFPEKDLATWRKKRDTLSLLQMAVILEDVAEALDFIHGQDQVHGDVKPGNILIEEDDEKAGLYHARLTDLGIAETIRASTATVFAPDGQTERYISPEHLENDPILLPASDQYSLACILYELLTGHTPFNGGWADVAMGHQNGERIPPSQKSPERKLPSSLDGVLLRALSKNARDRYPNCAQFARAFRDEVLATQQKQLAELMSTADIHISLQEYEKAFEALSEARLLDPENKSLIEKFEQVETGQHAARSYQDALEKVQYARGVAQELRKGSWMPPDEDDYLETLAPLPKSTREVLAAQGRDIVHHAWPLARWIMVMVVLGALIVLGFTSLPQGKPLQDAIGRLDPSPTFTPTITRTPTPTLTPTATRTGTATLTPTTTTTPTPDSMSQDRLAQIQLLASASPPGNLSFTAAEISPDGRFVAVGMNTGVIYIWDMIAQKWIGGTLAGHSGAVVAIEFVEDGQSLLSGSSDATIRKWDVGTRQELWRVDTGSPVRTFVSNQKHIAVLISQKTILLLSHQGVLESTWDVGFNDLRNISAIDLSASDQLAFAGTGVLTSYVYPWDPIAQKYLTTPVPETSYGYYIFMTSSGNWQSSPQVLKQPYQSGQDVSYSPDDAYLAIALPYQSQVFKVQSDQSPLVTGDLPSSSDLFLVEYSSDNQFLVGVNSRALLIWSADGRDLLAKIPAINKNYFLLSISKNNQTMIALSPKSLALFGLPRWDATPTPTITPSPTLTATETPTVISSPSPIP